MNSSKIPFETTSKPWFGPRKRAKTILASRTKVLSSQAALEDFRAIFAPHQNGIQRVRFIDYVHRDKSDFRYTIALIWTDSDAQLRDAVFDRAEECVKRTGWYPLPQGERIGSRLSDARFDSLGVRHLSDMPSVRIGNTLHSLENAVSADGGCSIRCHTNDGSIVFDTGLPPGFDPNDSDRIVLLTHTHLDHSGGLRKAFDSGLPVVMSRATARLLAALGRVSDRQLRESCVLLRPGDRFPLGDNVEVKAFAVPHCPGSTGFVLSDEDTTVVFSGDAVYSTARHDFLPDLLSVATSQRTLFLVDGTMAGRQHGASESDAASTTLQALEDYDDVLLVSNDAEQLLYAYLDLFFVSKSNPEIRSRIEFLASAELRKVFEVIHSAFIARNLDALDPFIASQYRSSMSAWAESRWLYWLGSDTEVPSNSPYKRIWLLPTSENEKVVPRGKIGYVGIGRAEDVEVGLPLAEKLGVDSAAWTLHSNENILCRSISTIEQVGRVVLFHNFSKRLRKFAKSNGIDCEVLGSDPIRF